MTKGKKIENIPTCTNTFLLPIFSYYIQKAGIDSIRKKVILEISFTGKNMPVKLRNELFRQINFVKGLNFPNEWIKGLEKIVVDSSFRKEEPYELEMAKRRYSRKMRSSLLLDANLCLSSLNYNSNGL